MANLQKIKLLAMQRNIQLGKLAERCSITHQSLNKIIRTNTTSIETLEKIASALEVPVGYFFDEEIEIRQAGRDFVEKGKIEHKGTEYNGPVTVESDLATENAELRRKLIEAQDKIIKLMEERK